MAKKGNPGKGATAEAATPETTSSAKLERHPLSEEFALPTTDEERLALASDMEVNGQHQDIILFEGKVLDGWERYMACLQKGITPKTKQYTGTNPAAVAFGANAIRRRLSSVQKAFYAARYYLHIENDGGKITQKEVAKLGCVSLNRLNEIVQLMKSTNPTAKAAVKTLQTNPDVNAVTLQTMLVDAGIVNPNERRATNAAANDATTPESQEDDDNLIDDLAAGANIDDLLDEDDDAPVRVSKPAGGGAEVVPLHSVKNKGGRVEHNRKANETPASGAARTFKGLTEPERLDFVKFAWPVLRPALEKCMAEGRIEWTPPAAVHADPSKAAIADVAAALVPTGKGARSKAPAAVADKPRARARRAA